MAIIVAFVLGALFVVPRSGAGFTAGTANSPNAFDADTLDPPTALTAADGVTVGLGWSATPDGYADGHRIMRSTTSGGPYTQQADLTPASNVSFVDSGTEGTYYYVVKAYAGAWESLYSNEVSARIWRAFDCPSDPDLRACIRFDTDVAGTYLDESGNSNTVTNTNGSQVPGISDKAAFAGPTTHYEMADSPSLDLTDAMTMEAWLKLDSLPSSGRAGILDNDGQYSLMLYAGTGLRCSNGISSLPHIPVPVGVWFHVGCAWDGTTLTLYIDGSPAASMGSTGTIATTNTNPVSLLNTSPLWDEPADGAIDNLRIWHSGRTQAQICADAGITGC